jgi:hypothetical protein
VVGCRSGRRSITEIPDKSIVSLSSGSTSSQTLIIDGDVRNALPVGQSVEIRLRKQAGANVLLSVNYG